MLIQKLETFPETEPPVDGALQTKFHNFDPNSPTCEECIHYDLCEQSDGSSPCRFDISQLDITGTTFSASTTIPIPILPGSRSIFPDHI